MTLRRIIVTLMGGLIILTVLAATRWRELTVWWTDNARAAGWFLLGTLLVPLIGVLLCTLLWALMAIWLSDWSWPRLARHMLLGVASALTLLVAIPRLADCIPPDLKTSALFAGFLLLVLLLGLAVNLGLDIPLPEDELSLPEDEQTDDESVHPEMIRRHFWMR